MSSSGGATVHVGTPPSDLGTWTTTEVCFHKFADLTTTRNEHVYSPEFTCLGHRWTVKIFPGGDDGSKEGYVGMYLFNESDADITVQYGFSIRDVAGKEVVHLKPEICEFGAWAEHNFAKRSAIMKSLVNGTLLVEVRISRADTSKSPPHYTPKNPINKNILSNFNIEESADIMFEVESEIEKESETGERESKRSKATRPFYAHYFILKDISSTLAEMCKGGDALTAVTTVPITDVKPNIFRHMLFYIYGGILSDEELKQNAKEIIDACDKYGVVGLKLKAESCYVNSTTITINNMIDNLLYADSKNLALLKETVIDFAVEKSKDIIGKVSFDNVPSYMMTDLLTAVARGANRGARVYRKDYDEEEALNTMRVSELREMLDIKGLDVDGSREAMIAVLKEQQP